MDSQEQEFSDTEKAALSATCNKRAIPIWLGPVLSIGGLTGISVQISDWWNQWADLNRFAEAKVVLGVSITLLGLGSLASRLSGSAGARNSSRAIFVASAGIVFAVGILFLLAVALVVWVMLLMAKK